MSNDAVDTTTPEDERSAYEKAQEEQEDVDPRTIPQKLDEEPPIGDEIDYPDYPEEDHETWQILVERQMEQLPGRACEAYLRGQDVLGLEADRIPHLADLSRRLHDETGWTVAHVPGLIHEKDFFTLLSERKFPSTNYVRPREELNYTPAPDCFHDIFGPAWSASTGLRSSLGCSKKTANSASLGPESCLRTRRSPTPSPMR